jgi:hypothetical protein
MFARNYRLLSACMALLVLSSYACAAPNFGNNAIGFTAIPGVAGKYRVTDNFATLVKTQLVNGFSVNYTYTITSIDGVTAVDTTWTATRRFCLAVAENLAVTITGNTTVSSNNAATLAGADLVVNGTILGQAPDVDFFQGPPLANNMAINWNKTSKAANVPGGNACYTLQMFSGPTWTPRAVGDTISFQSEYVITVDSQPNPPPTPTPTPLPTPPPMPSPTPSPSPIPSPTPVPSPVPSPTAGAHSSASIQPVGVGTFNIAFVNSSSTALDQILPDSSSNLIPSAFQCTNCDGDLAQQTRAAYRRRDLGHSEGPPITDRYA